VVTLAGLPMAAPDTRSSTLRFCWRPAEVSFEATGRVLPKPLAAANLSFVHEGSSALAAIVVGTCEQARREIIQLLLIILGSIVAVIGGLFGASLLRTTTSTNLSRARAAMGPGRATISPLPDSHILARYRLPAALTIERSHTWRIWPSTSPW
jgi:hypothetical protein